MFLDTKLDFDECIKKNFWRKNLFVTGFRKMTRYTLVQKIMLSLKKSYILCHLNT